MPLPVAYWLLALGPFRTAADRYQNYRRLVGRASMVHAFEYAADTVEDSYPVAIIYNIEESGD